MVLFVDSYTTLVVGAGASAEFGLPTGAGIFEDLLNESSELAMDRPFNIFRDSFSAPFPNFISNAKGSYNSQPIADLIQKANSSFHDSIDMFSYVNAATLELSKLYTAWKIYAGLSELKSTDARFDGNSRSLVLSQKWRSPRIGDNKNWITSFLQKYTEGAEGPDDLVPDAYSIVTFNYDCIIEDALLFFLKASERFAGVTAEQLPVVRHVNGTLPMATDDCLQPRAIWQASKGIRYLMDEHQSDELYSIRSNIGRSDNIFLLGFACDPRNVDIIGLKETNAEFFGVNYNGNEEINSRLKQLGAREENILSGSEDRPMSLGRACGQGLFSLPSSF